MPSPARAPAPLSAPAPAEVSLQVRAARAACAAEVSKQGMELVDFVNFSRLDENNWDSTVRVRRKTKLVRVGCRHDLRAGWTNIYEPAASDGGNPWGPGGAPKSTASPPSASPVVPVAPVAPVGPATPGSSINLNLVADTTARAAIARTRDACIAEAARRKIRFDDFDAFRRVDAAHWEAMLLIRKDKSDTRSCRFDTGSGKAVIK